MSSRIHRIPSGSRPLTGSSDMRTSGSPSRAAAMPSRWLMPSEKPSDRLPQLLVILVRPGMNLRPVHFQMVTARPVGQQVALLGL